MTDGEIPDRPAGQSFRGRTLEDADFSRMDVRGADFTGANLRSANFRDATLGVAPRMGVLLLAIAILVSIAAGVAIGFAMDEVRRRVSAENWDEVAEGGSLGLILVVLVALIFWRGFDVAIRTVAVLYLVVLAANVVANLLWEEFEWIALVRATAVMLFLIVAITIGMLARVVGGVFGAWSIAFVAVLGGLASGQAEGGAAGIIVAVSLALISKRALRGDQRDRWLRRIAHRLVARWGTKFVDADLTGADFTGTDTSRCGVEGATLDGVTWDPNQPLPLDLPDEAIPADR